MNKTNTYSTILGGCWREKVVSDFGFGHSKSHFWEPENGHFPQKWPFSGMSPRVAKGRQGSPRVAKVQGGPQGWVRCVKIRSIIFESISAHTSYLSQTLQVCACVTNNFHYFPLCKSLSISCTSWRLKTSRLTSSSSPRSLSKFFWTCSRESHLLL